MRIHTGYSFRHAVGDLESVAKRLVEIGYQRAPITDRVSTYGYTRWSKICEKYNLNPIYGVELPVVISIEDKKPAIDWWAFLAIDNIKWINDLVYLATSQGRLPCLSYEQALAAQGVVKIAGEQCQMRQLRKIDNLYMALSPGTSKGLINDAIKMEIPFVASSINSYCNLDDKELYRVILGHRAHVQTYAQHILSDAEWFLSLEGSAHNGELIAATLRRDTVFNKCNAKLKKATLLKPEKKQSLKNLCLISSEKLGLCQYLAIQDYWDWNDSVYEDRLRKELDLIAEKDFEDYFYILADLMQFARQNMIVGPARGSSCGSLVCYLLGITSIDPIKFDLLFERFIDSSRDDLPDVDLDFSDERRYLIFEYLENKYGKDRVARLGNVITFKPKSAMNAIGAALKIPKWRLEKTLDGLIEHGAGAVRALCQIEDTLTQTQAGQELARDYPAVMLAARMEGHPNTASQHAAGVLLTEEPIAEYVAIDARTGGAMCDKKDAEDRNLLKIDALGLTQLSVFERTLELIHGDHQQGFFGTSGNEFLNRISLNDARAFDVINAGNYSGIFQFNGIALQRLTKEITVTHLEDLVSITALARPGPMSSGGAGDWIKRKRGLDPVTYPHACYEPILSPTLGVMIYQEQVMRILREVGLLEWPDVMMLRRAMGKTLGKEFFSTYGEKWKKGAASQGVAGEKLDRLWDDLCGFGQYAFNRSHSVAYAIISYWCAWFKSYHSLEFAAATLDAEKDAMRQLDLLRELYKEGITYVSVDMEHSVERWTPAQKEGKQILVGPLTAVKGIGPATVKEILKARSEGKQLRSTLVKRLNEAKTEIDDLFPISAAIKRLHPDLSAINIMTKPWAIDTVQCGVDCDVVITGLITKMTPKDRTATMFIADDSDKIYARCWDWELSEKIMREAKVGKSLYAIKGSVPKGFRMIKVKNVRYLGELDG